MGVPSLYRWLTQKYPEIKEHIGKTSKTRTDNLYLDFNAIIHPCCNKGLLSMEHTDLQLYSNLNMYIDDVMNRIRPTKLLYISVDGVAPRAKLNQQRARRFIKAKETDMAGEKYFKDEKGADPEDFVRFLKENVTEKKKNRICEQNVSEEEELSLSSKEIFDVNAITPGTEFMVRLDNFIQELIKYKLSNDELWKDLNVIYSNFRVPGEGEQKIMEYIKKAQNYKATHVIYSPDADLIFLGLTLFDYKIFIMREEVQRAASFQESEIDSKSDRDEFCLQTDPSVYEKNHYIFVNISTLKKFVINDFRAAIKGNFDYKRFIEDWVFLCFSIGNDFLPCTPSFEIRSNAIEKITSLLITVFLNTRCHITDNGRVNYKILKEFFIECAKRENEFLREKRENLIFGRKKFNLPFDDHYEYPLDNERGKIRFYMEKMGITSEKELLEACKEYIKGLEWVYKYYFYSLPSWDWFYPYHFAPFMADLACVDNVHVSFNLGRPLRPMEQLMAVLPPLSKDLLPRCLHSFFDENSQIYPTDFKVDCFYKVMDWQAVPILPFVELDKIIKGFNSRQSQLTYAEAERNVIGYSVFYTRNSILVRKVSGMYEGLKAFENIESDDFTGKVFPISSSSMIGDEVESVGFKYTNKAIAFTFDQRYWNKKPFKK